MNQKYIAAIEIGSSKIKGAIASVDDANVMSIIASDEVNLATDDMTDSVRYGIIQNVEKVTTAMQGIIERLQRGPGMSKREIRKVYVGVGLRSLRATQVDVARSFGDEIEITADLLDQLKEEARGMVIGDKEILAVTPRCFAVDNRKSTNSPIGVFARKINASFMVTTCKPTATRNITRVLHERLGLNIVKYIVRPIAEAELVLTDEERRLGCMLVDFGAETITTTIYREGVMNYLATLPLGSRNITRDLMSLNHTEQRANDIKCSLVNVDSEEINNQIRSGESVSNTEVNNISMARTHEIIANILEQIRYADLDREQLPGGIILTGNGAKLRGFVNLLRKTSKMAVRFATVPSNIRYQEARIQLNDSIDIVAVLAAALRQGAEECTYVAPSDSLFEDPADEIPEATEEEIKRTNKYYGNDETGATGSRIGSGFDEDYFTPQDDDDYEDDDPVEEPKPDKQKSVRSRFFDGLKKRIENIITPEDESDSF